MPRARIGDLLVHYQQMGRGPDLVMIHGLFANLAFWYLSVAPALARSFRVTVYDLRGHGYSSVPGSGYTSSHQAADLHGLLDHLDIEQAHVVGHSFGGAIGLHYAVLHPERVRSLALADARVPSLERALPSPGARQWKVRRNRLRRSGVDVSEDVPHVAYDFLEELARLRPVARQETGSLDVTTLLDGWTTGSRRGPGMRQWHRLVRATSAPADFSNSSGLTLEHIRQVGQPTLALYGEDSRCQRTLRGLRRALPRCTTVIVPGVGHFHPLLKPDTFTEALESFILALKD
jgi:pimeloyl-ACP methyl ester carboxylesterase